MCAPKTLVVLADPRRSCDDARVVSPDRGHERARPRGRGRRDEHLLDVAAVERPDEQELDQRRERRAEDEPGERGEQEARQDRDAAELRLGEPERVGSPPSGRRRVRSSARPSPVDQGQPGGDQEVHRAQPEPGDREQQERGHRGAPRSSSDPEHPMDHRLVVQQLRGRADVNDPARVQHDGVTGNALHDPEVLLDEQDRRQLGGSSQSTLATSVTSSGASPLVGSSIRRTRLPVQERAERSRPSAAVHPTASRPAGRARSFSSGKRS